MWGCWRLAVVLISARKLGADDGGEIGFQDLERDLALVVEVDGQVDRGHAAFAGLPHRWRGGSPGLRSGG